MQDVWPQLYTEAEAAKIKAQLRALRDNALVRCARPFRVRAQGLHAVVARLTCCACCREPSLSPRVYLMLWRPQCLGALTNISRQHSLSRMHAREPLLTRV